MTRYWIGVASQNHVSVGVAQGFCQLCHGQRNPLERLTAGDWLIYYSPRTEIRGGEAVQSFTAIGQILAGDAYQVEMAEGFVPYRRRVQFLAAVAAPIRPLLNQLSFTQNRPSWGYAFRFGLFEISAADFEQIATAMQVKPDLVPAP